MMMRRIAVALVGAAVACGATADDLSFVEKLVRGKELKPVSVTVNKAGHTVVDFGKHGFGWIVVDTPVPATFSFAGTSKSLAKGVSRFTAGI